MRARATSRSAAGAFFGNAWWDAVLAAWNRSEARERLAGLGTVRFVLQEPVERAVLVHWDAEGAARRQRTGPARTPSFAATRKDWKAFLQGEFGAAAGVLTGRIKFRGSFTAVYPHVAGFNELARIARPFLRKAGRP